MSKAANVSSNVNLEWMMMLRSRARGGVDTARKGGDGDDEEGSGDRRRARRSNYSPGMVPRVYYKETGNQQRDKIRPFEYAGNFYDIQHLTKREEVGKGSIDVS